MTGHESNHQARRERVSLWLILLVSLVARLLLAPHRWIGPDEGAHLMDGILVLDGLIPAVDFASRQPVYTYLLSGFLALVGPNYAGVRIVAVLVSIANIYLVHAIAKRFFGGRIGVLAALLFAVLPLSVTWAPVVHTEPFAMLLSGLGIYFLVRHLQDDSRGFLIAAGVTLSLAFFVRESSFGALVAAVVGLVLWSAGNLRRLSTRMLLLGASFLVPCVVIGALYLRHLTLAEWWVSQINPLSLFIKTVSGVSAALRSAAPDGSVAALRMDEQPWAATVNNLYQALMLCSGLVLGLLGSGVLLARSLIRRREEQSPPWKELGLLYAWVGALTLMYAYWVLHRGFFPQYAEEFLPALSIVTAWAAMQLYNRWQSPGRPVRAVMPFAVLAGLAFVQVKLWPRLDVPNYWYFLVPAVGLAWIQLPRSGRVGRWLVVLATEAGILVVLHLAPTVAPSLASPVRLLLVPVVLASVYLMCPRGSARSWKEFSAYAGLTLLLTAFGMSFAASGRKLGFKSTSTWSPGVVSQVSDYLRANSKPGDEVASGAVIWELQAGRRPFANLSHPLGLLVMSPDAAAAESARLEALLATHPPRFIVMDGYTELTYGTRINLRDVLDRRYRLRLTATGSAFPVLVYQLR